MTQTNRNQKISNSGIDPNPIRISMVIIKGLCLFLIFNMIFAVAGSPEIGKISLYNLIFPGRFRLPFGENPNEAYNFSLNNLDAMFASHTISGKVKTENEFRIIVIGDSSTWGILLKPEETITGLINKAELNCKGRNVKAYNLGYPTLSLTKDILIMDQALQYKPDLIIWPVTLEAFPSDKQFSSLLVINNLDKIKNIFENYPLKIEGYLPEKIKQNIYEKSIVGQRRNLADILRLQLYGIMWAATGIDQVYPDDYDHAQIDLEGENTFHGWTTPEQLRKGLALNILETGLRIAGDIPVLIINEPILISSGKNSDIRYNFYYPRWAYDQYRKILEENSAYNNWRYLDLWNIVPSDEFTNSAIHMNPFAETIYAKHVIDEIRAGNCQ